MVLFVVVLLSVAIRQREKKKKKAVGFELRLGNRAEEIYPKGTCRV